MRSLLRQVETALQVFVERNAIAEQILDTAPCLTRHGERDALIDDAGTRAKCVGGMGLRTVAFGKRCRDTGLGPHARCAFAELCPRDQGDRDRRELQCGEQAGKACTDNDHAAPLDDRRRRGPLFAAVGHRLPLSPRLR